MCVVIQLITFEQLFVRCDELFWSSPFSSLIWVISIACVLRTTRFLMHYGRGVDK